MPSILLEEWRHFSKNRLRKRKLRNKGNNMEGGGGSGGKKVTAAVDGGGSSDKGWVEEQSG